MGSYEYEIIEMDDDATARRRRAEEGALDGHGGSAAGTGTTAFGSAAPDIPQAPECMPDEELLYDLADLFKTFADTTRIRILYALMGQDRGSAAPDIPQAPECMPDEELLYDLADLFKTFADTTRIRILYALMGQDRCVAEIAEIIGATQSAVSHQLRTLKQARLVKFQRDGKNIIYSLSDDHVYTMLAQGMTHICE